MSDDLDDDISLDDSFDDFEKKEGTLGDLWRNNPLFKIGVIVGAVILIFVVISIFSGGEGPVDQSWVGAAPDVESTPGTEEVSPEYAKAIEELNEAEIERAINEGDSSLPVPVEPPVGIVNLPDQEQEAEDPLQRWRRLQEERLEREIQQRENVLPQQDMSADVERSEAIQALADAMGQQMSSILEAQTPPNFNTVQLTHPDFLEALKEDQAKQDAELQSETLSAEDEVGDDVVGEVILPAGKIAYAQLLTEANTDVPGPVLAEIMSGPLKGSRILGTFQEQNELLTLTFDTVVYKDESLSIDAVGLDPDTTLAGMATDVDHRYLKRVILPAAAAFVEGFTGAIAETATVTVVTDGGTVVDSGSEPDNTEEVATGVEEAGQKLGEILDDMAEDTEVLVRIEAGTPIGILFLEPVTKDDNVDGGAVTGAAGTDEDI